MPFLKSEYFQNQPEKAIFDLIKDYATKFSKCPTKEALLVCADKLDTLSQEEFIELQTTIKEVAAIPPQDNIDWLVDETEKFSQDKALYNGIMESIQILDGKSTQGKGMIPEILRDALAVSFDSSVGHDYLGEAENRYTYYHTKEVHMPFDLEKFNKITGGGLLPKTLNVILAGTGVGKTLIKCHMAANMLAHGKNVVYFTCEMAEEKIAERIDANLMNIALDDLKLLPKDKYLEKITKMRQMYKGHLVVKEYPPASAHVGHFRHFLHELWIKKGIKPDAIIVDYLNLCTSSRVKLNNQVNTYVLIKCIAEELRGLGVEKGVPVLTSTQTNREGFNNSDVDLTNTSESFGLPATADLMFAAVRSETMDKMNQMMVKQLKNRYTDMALLPRFVVGVDRAKMKLYDLDESAQAELNNVSKKSTSTNSGVSAAVRSGDSNRRGNSNFSKFKFG